MFVWFLEVQYSTSNTTPRQADEHYVHKKAAVVYSVTVFDILPMIAQYFVIIGLGSVTASL